MATRQHAINIILLFSLALTVRISILAFHGFDGLYGQDAFAYYDFAGDILYFVETLNPPPPFFWSLGYSLQLAIGFGIFGISESVALGISVLMGSSLSALVYILAIQLNLRSPYAFIAGLIMGFSGQAIQSSLVIMSDIPTLFLAITSLISLLHYIKTDKRRWILLCAFTVSLASISRWIYLIFPAVYVIALAFVWKRDIRWKDLILAFLVASIPIIPQIIFNQVNPTPLLDHSWVQGWSPLNALSKDFINIDGTFHYQTINALFYAYPLYDLSYLSPLLTLFVPIGIFNLIRRCKLYQIILLLGLLCLPYLFLVGIPYQNIRFSLILFPAATILIGIGLQSLTNIQHPIRWGVILLALVGFIHTATNGFDYANNFIEHHQSEKEIITWLDEKVPDTATLYTMGSTLTLEHYTDISIIEIFYETPNTLKQRWFKGRADYLLLNLWQIENQWQGRDPQFNYHWFRDERGLTEIGKFRNLTLFEASS